MNTIRSLAARAAAAAAAGLWLAAAAPARAEMTLKEYLPYAQSPAPPPAVKSYVDGLGAGYVWANAYLASREEPPIFCAPGLRPPGEDYVSLLDAQIASHAGLTKPYEDDTAVALILLDALINAFPCKR